MNVVDAIMANLKADLDSYLSGNRGGGGGGSVGGVSLSNLAKSFTLPTLKSPFSSSSSSTDQQLLMEEGSDETEVVGSSCDCCQCLPSLSKRQRIVGFGTCLALGITCFLLASLYVPMLLLYARKFALLFSLGSAFTLGSFSFLWGPYAHLRHLLGRERLPFTSAYLLTLFGTLYFAVGLQSTVLTVVAATGQLMALTWFVLSYVPGGQTGLKFFSKVCSSFCKATVGRSLPV